MAPQEVPHRQQSDDQCACRSRASNQRRPLFGIIVNYSWYLLGRCGSPPLRQLKVTQQKIRNDGDHLSRWGCDEDEEMSAALGVRPFATVDNDATKDYDTTFYYELKLKSYLAPISMRFQSAVGVMMVLAAVPLHFAAASSCPDLCNGHGRCDSSATCQCFNGWGASADCSLRTCPLGGSWADIAALDGTAHS